MSRGEDDFDRIARCTRRRARTTGLVIRAALTKSRGLTRRPPDRYEASAADFNRPPNGVAWVDRAIADAVGDARHVPLPDNESFTSIRARQGVSGSNWYKAHTELIRSTPIFRSTSTGDRDRLTEGVTGTTVTR